MALHVDLQGGTAGRTPAGVMVARVTAAAGALALLVVSCVLDRMGTSSPAADAGITTAGAGGHAGSTTSSGAAPAGGGTAGAAATGGGVGASGGGIPLFVNDGLIVRYFIDEADTGTGPTQLEDAAPSPRPLVITYEPELAYTEAYGQRALAWTTEGGSGRASVAIAGTKIQSGLQGSTTGTIEVVVDIAQVTSNHSRITHIGYEQELGRFTLASPAVNQLELVINDSNIVGLWSFSLSSAQRTVLHAVFDSAPADPNERAKLYADGSLVAGNSAAPPPQNVTLDLHDNTHLVLGNREVGERSFRGRLHYAALYAVALSEAQVLNNATLLLADDDAP